MRNDSSKGNRKRFFVRIILPSILAIVLFVLSIFAIILPSLEKNIMDRKREMIRELTNSAWSILSKYEKDERDSLLSKEEAQKKAISEVHNLRYGEEMKDYFWITDMSPNMIMHPYRPDLNGKPLNDFKDAHGKKLFVEFVNVVRKDTAGYVDYMWQWKDDTSRIVPKLSYVKLFKPWQWIIGTGIYVEDVKEEISNMENSLIKISALITLIIALLLVFIIRQSDRIEHNRRMVELELKNSKERYRALVEASTEGSLMIFEDEVYANKFLLGLLEYDENKIKKLDIFDIISDEKLMQQVGNFRELAESLDVPRQFESKLRKKNGEEIEVMLNISKISIGGKEAIIAITKNLFGNSVAEEDSTGRKQLMDIADSLQIGVFRSVLARRSTFAEANSVSVSILGLQSKDELYKTNIEDLFADPDERRTFVKDLIQHGYVKEKIIRILKKDGTLAYIRVSLSVSSGIDDHIKYCNGIVEDVTERQIAGMAREEIISEMQSFQSLLYLPLSDFLNPPVVCNMNDSVQKAASMMETHKSRAVLVKTPDNGVAGIITEDDISKRVVAAGTGAGRPVYEIMSAPVIAVSESSLLYEAIIKMQENGVNHLAVIDADGRIKNIVSSYDFLSLQKSTGSFIVQKIKNASAAEALVPVQYLVQHLVKYMIGVGTEPFLVTRMISSVSDAVIEKLCRLAVEELGEPPVPFAFITLGSVGREEQTLATDQDNALIYQDTATDRAEEVHAYFLRFGEKVCSWLNRTGYAYCKGNIMAKNPEYCQPVSVWKKYFSEWVATKEPQSLLDVNIFFDFRFAYGEEDMASDLKEHISKLLEQNNLFFYHLAQNTLLLKSPISIFGNIIKESRDKHSDSFDIKKAIMPVVGFSRIYALKNGIADNNTMTRASKIFERNIISRTEYDSIRQMYSVLMNLRLRHQSEQIAERMTTDNYINPDKLTELDQAVLKKIFTQVNNLFAKLSLDFKGTIN